MQPTDTKAAPQSRPRRLLLIGALSVVAIGGAGYGALSCQGVRNSLLEAADTGYKSSASDPIRAKGAPPVAFETVVEGVDNVTDLRYVPGHDDLLVVLGKNGTATWHVVADGRATETGTFLTSKVRTKSELGLLGIAFHPKFNVNGRLFVNETPRGGDLRTRIAEYRADPKAPKKGATFVKSILEVNQPYSNHDAGQLLFGPDGFLYIGLGDGGWRNDPEENGQNLKTLLGSMLRIDVDKADQGRAYSIPKDNPFVGVENARDEIFAYGLRNPWRFTFAKDGRLIVGDVGQDKYEEITIVSKGENHGWKIREAGHCFSPKIGCKSEGLTDPVFEYDHSIGASVTGGVLYQGRAFPSLKDKYLFADFVRGHIWAMDVPSVADAAKGPVPGRATRLGTFPALWSSFAQEPNGEVLVADFGGGKVVRLIPQPKASADKAQSTKPK